MVLKSKYPYGIIFDGQRSNDFGLDVAEKTIGMPAKKKIIQELPYSNNVLDLSELFGNQQYEERPYEVTFIVHDSRDYSKEHLYLMWTKAVNWLMQPARKVKLVDDIMSNYYYLGEAQKATSWEEFRSYGNLTVEFTCYPFRISELAEGNDIWDIFNFELDIAQNTDYEIKGSRTITLLNIGNNLVAPQLVSNAPFIIEMNGQTYSLGAGTYESPDFMLLTGETKLNVTGTGKLSFIWHKELI